LLLLLLLLLLLWLLSIANLDCPDLLALYENKVASPLA
jgi:hypothetical protein